MPHSFTTLKGCVMDFLKSGEWVVSGDPPGSTKVSLVSFATLRNSIAEFIVLQLALMVHDADSFETYFYVLSTLMSWKDVVRVYDKNPLTQGSCCVDFVVEGDVLSAVMVESDVIMERLRSSQGVEDFRSVFEVNSQSLRHQQTALLIDIDASHIQIPFLMKPREHGLVLNDDSLGGTRNVTCHHTIGGPGNMIHVSSSGFPEVKSSALVSLTPSRVKGNICYTCLPDHLFAGVEVQRGPDTAYRIYRLVNISANYPSGNYKVLSFFEASTWQSVCYAVVTYLLRNAH